MAISYEQFVHRSKKQRESLIKNLEKRLRKDTMKKLDEDIITQTIKDLINDSDGVPFCAFDVGANNEFGISLVDDNGKEFVFNILVTNCTEDLQ